MSSCEDSNINKSYVIQTVGDVDIFSACTEIYLTNIIPCTGDTININSNLNVTGDISGTTYYGDGSQLSGIITTDNYVTGGVYTASTKSLYFTGTTGFTPFSIDVSALLDDTNNYVTGGTYNPSTDIISLFRNDNVTINITGVTDTFTTGGTYDNGTSLITFVKNDNTSYTVDLSSIDVNDTFVTGSTLNGDVLTIRRNDGVDIVVTGFSQTFTGNTSGTCIGDIYVSNIHSCSPLRINSNDEGNVYFGSTSGITLDVLNQRVGIGTNSPTESLVVSGNTIVGGTLTIGNIPSGKPVNNLGFDSGGTVVIGTTGDTDTNTFVTGGTLSGNDLILEKNNDVDVNPIDLSGLVSGKTDLTLFNSHTGDTSNPHQTSFGNLTSTAHTHTLSEITDFNTYSGDVQTQIDGKVETTLFNTHTGDTNNPHQTSFSNLTATAHTHTISEVVNLQTELDSKTDNTDFISHTGDTTIHFTKGDISLSEIGNSAHTHTLSEITDFNPYSGSVQTQLDAKVETTVFNSHTGDTNNPHQTSFSNLTATAHTHTISEVVNLQTELDNKTDLTLFNTHTGDTNNPHQTSFANLTSTAHTHTISDVINLQTELDSKLDVSTFNSYSGNVETELNTKISGATNLSSEGVFAQKNGLDLEFKGITSTGGTVNISSNSTSVNLEVTFPTDQDKFVSGGTYNGGTKEINFVGNSVETTFDVDLTSLVNSVTGDTFVTGQTFSNTTYVLSTTRNDGTTFNSDLSVLASDVYVLSGVYNPSTGIVTYTNSTGGTFQVSGFTTGMTDSYTTAANLNGETIEFDNNIQGSNLYSVSLTPILSGKTDLTLFNTHTGDTNNPHQTSFSNLTATAHTHSISDVINLQTELDSKTNNTDFISHTGDTTIHFTKGDINLSDLGSTAHTHSISEVINLQTELDNKTDLTLFNSHTGDTNNPHQTSFSNLSSTAHTHTLSEITDFNSYSGDVQTQIDGKLNITDFNTYSGSVQTQLDAKIENGINSGGANEVFSGKSGTDLYFRTISGGSNTTITTIDDIIKVDVSVPVDTNTYVTGGTYSSGTLTLNRNDNNSVVVTGFTTGGGGDNFYVTGFTYDDANTLTISRNGGLGDLSATINTLTGLTIDGVLSASTYTGLTLNDLDDVTTGIPTTPDNTYQGRQIYFDVTTNQWLSTEEYATLGTVTIWGKKGTAGTISKGLPVYITGFDNDIHDVELANASTGATMPVIGFTGEDFDNAGVYPLITFGKLTGVNTTSGTTTLNPNGETWEVNDELYMSTTTGGLTKFRPTGTDTQIQRIAKVLKVGTTDGQLFIFNTARTAGLPNLTSDYLWVGNGNDTPQEVIRTDVGITTTGFTYNDNNTFTITDDNGGSLSATINQFSGLTINGDLDVTGDTTLNTLTATSITSNSAINVFNGHINLRDNSYFLQGRTVADVNVSLIGVDNQDRVFIGNAGYDTYIDSDTIVDGTLSAQTAVLTTIPALNNSATDILVRNSSTGEVEYRSVQTIGNNITTVTGTTYSATTTDDVIGVDTTSNAVSIYLPDSISSGNIRYDIKDIGLNSLTNNITIIASGSDTILTTSSVSSIVISNNGSSLTLVNNGSGQWWQI